MNAKCVNMTVKRTAKVQTFLVNSTVIMIKYKNARAQRGKLHRRINKACYRSFQQLRSSVGRNVSENRVASSLSHMIHH